MRLHLKIDHKETGKQCAAISTGLVLGALAQIFLEPQKIRALALIFTIVGAIIWYIIAQYFFMRQPQNNKNHGAFENDPV